MTCIYFFFFCENSNIACIKINIYLEHQGELYVKRVK
jgi:hypothetical protein